MEEKIRRLEEWAQGNKQPPIGIELAPTLRCNLNCKFCWRRDEEFNTTREEMRDKEMSTERYMEIIEEAGEMGVEEVKVIGGGESTYRNDTLQIMEKIKENGLYGYLCTNGSLLTREEIERMIEIGWDHVKFSLHGTKETHNSLVERDVYDKVLENIERFSESDVDVEIGMVVVNRNYREVENMLDIASDLGVDHLFLEPITVYSKIGEKLTLSDDEEKELRKNLERLEKKNKERDINTNFMEFVRNNLVDKTNEMKEYILSQLEGEGSFNDLPCYEPFLRMGIRVDGRVAPCGFYDQERGDSVRNRSLEEVWYGDYFQERREEQKNKQLPDYCSKCCTTLVNKQERIRNSLSELL